VVRTRLYSGPELSTFVWSSRGLTYFTLYSVDFERRGCLFRRCAPVSDAICSDTRIFKGKSVSRNYANCKLTKNCVRVVIIQIWPMYC